MKSELRIFTPVGMLGYGFSETIFWSTLENRKVDAIILDSGSTDGGPFTLAVGRRATENKPYERDLGLLVAASHAYRVPILIGT
jgi:hypothetical protein